jgi:hypothetical protein
VIRLVNGDQSKSLSNEEKGWFLSDKVEVAIGYAIKLANRGFLLNHQQLKELADNICSARLGNQFPRTGVGKKWTGCFVEKHHNRLWTYWSHTLDK